MNGTTNTSEPIGYIVLLHEHGRWNDNWDGEVHQDRVSGDKALAAARAAGYEAVLTAAIQIGGAK